MDLIEDGKVESFVLENIQLVFFNDGNSVFVYLGDVNSIDIVTSGEILEDFTIKYSDWKTYIVEANIVACYEFSNLKLGEKYILTEAFKLNYREIVNIN